MRLFRSWVGLFFVTVATAKALAAPSLSLTANTLSAGLPLLGYYASYSLDDAEGAKQQALTLGATVLSTLTLKKITHIQRPDGSDHQSFPSAHTSVAFAAAAFLDQRYRLSGSTTASLYSLAALSGMSRVNANKHRWGDVLGGAALGMLTASHFTTPSNVTWSLSMNQGQPELNLKFKLAMW